MVYKMEEWQGATGNWYCNCLSNIGGGSALWYHPARILNMEPADFLLWLKDTYNPCFYYRDDGSFVGYYWESQAEMRKYKNLINKKAREVNYLI